MNELINPVDPNRCPICGNPPYKFVPADWFPEWHCPRCGNFDYDCSIGWRQVSSSDEMVRLSGWVREQNAAGLAPVRITPDTAARVTRMPLPRLRERASRVLVEIARRWPQSEASFNLEFISRNLKVQGLSYSQNEREVLRLLEILTDDGCFRQTSGSGGFALSVRRLLAAEALGDCGSSSPQGFVAMWFDQSLQDAWTNGFDPGIRAAGFKPIRIDNKDYVGGITDEIMAEIRRSRFVVADYTGQVNGVYFEAGFALGLGLTIIPSCHAEEVGKLHFDIKHLNTLLWKTPAELAGALDRRIRAVIGAGPDA